MQMQGSAIEPEREMKFVRLSRRGTLDAPSCLNGILERRPRRVPFMSDLLTNLGAAVLLSREELLRLIRSAPHRYKTYQIPKRNPGQFRTIAQPAREVKTLQYWVM